MRSGLEWNPAPVEPGARKPFFNRGGYRSRIKFYHVACYGDFHPTPWNDGHAITLTPVRHKRNMQFLTSAPNFRGSANPPPPDPAFPSPCAELESSAPTDSGVTPYSNDVLYVADTWWECWRCICTWWAASLCLFDLCTRRCVTLIICLPPWNSRRRLQQRRP